MSSADNSGVPDRRGATTNISVRSASAFCSNTLYTLYDTASFCACELRQAGGVAGSSLGTVPGSTQSGAPALGTVPVPGSTQSGRASPGHRTRQYTVRRTSPGPMLGVGPETSMLCVPKQRGKPRNCGAAANWVAD